MEIWFLACSGWSRREGCGDESQLFGELEGLGAELWREEGRGARVGDKILLLERLGCSCCLKCKCKCDVVVSFGILKRSIINDPESIWPRGNTEAPNCNEPCDGGVYRLQRFIVIEVITSKIYLYYNDENLRNAL